MWEREFKKATEVRVVEKEAAPTLNLVSVVEPSKVSREIEDFFESVLDYLGYDDRSRDEHAAVRWHDLAKEGIVVPPISDRLAILEIKGRQVALVFECRDDDERSLLIGCSDLTTELLSELQRDPDTEPTPRGHIRLVEKNRVFSTRERARVVLADYETAGELPLKVADFEGVSNVSNAFASEFLNRVKDYCREHDCPFPELWNMVPFVEKQVRWVMDNQDCGEFRVVLVEAAPAS